MCIIAVHKGNVIMPYKKFYSCVVNNDDSYGLYYFNSKTKKGKIIKHLPSEFPTFTEKKRIVETRPVTEYTHFQEGGFGYRSGYETTYGYTPATESKQVKYRTYERVVESINYEKYVGFLYNEYLNLAKKAEDDDIFIIHCRIRTHGLINLDNCQPFYDEELGVVFAHNGTLTIREREDIVKTNDKTIDDWDNAEYYEGYAYHARNFHTSTKSDSKIFFEQCIIPHVRDCGMITKGFHNLAEEYFQNQSSRGVIFHEKDQNVYMLNFSKWIEDNEIYYSNTSFSRGELVLQGKANSCTFDDGCSEKESKKKSKKNKNK